MKLCRWLFTCILQETSILFPSNVNFIMAISHATRGLKKTKNTDVNRKIQENDKTGGSCVRRLLSVVTKFIVFFIGWALCIGFDIPFNDPVLWRLGAEAIPLAVIIIFSIIFWLIEKREFPIAMMTNHSFKNILEGIAVGSVWLGSAILILVLTHSISFVGTNPVRLLPVWMFACFLNTIMQELLARGYLYQLIKKNYNPFAATVVTTILFTLMHGGAFEAGVIPVLNVITMSIFMTVALEYTQSILVPIMLHFIWNGVGAIILGGVSLASDYPSLLQVSYSGNTFLSGGICKIEGSIVVLFLNLLFIIIFSILNSRSNRSVK